VKSKSKSKGHSNIFKEYKDESMKNKAPANIASSKILKLLKLYVKKWGKNRGRDIGLLGGWDKNNHKFPPKKC